MIITDLTTEEYMQMKQVKKHDSMRGEFAYQLYKLMVENEDVFLITGDLGFGMFDYIKRDFPDRFINTGAAEQAMMGIGVGLALQGKIPFVYSITPFLLYRPFETIRNYVNHEKIPVLLVGGGRDTEYAHDGYSHNAEDVKNFIHQFRNIWERWPSKKEEIPEMMREISSCKNPVFLSLIR